MDFIDDSIILSSGKKTVYDPDKTFVFRYDLEFEEEMEYDYELERSLRHRINQSIKENGDNVSLLEEMPSYIDKSILEEHERANKKVQDEHVVDVNNLFFGTKNMSVSSGILKMNMNSISWFEYTNMDMFGYHIFRSIPEGDYCLVDDEANIHIPEEILSENDILIGPNSTIRNVNIANIPTIFENAIRILEENPTENEETILTSKAMLESLEYKGNLTVGEIRNYDDIIRELYEIAYGEIFNRNDADYDMGEDYHKKQ